MTFSKLDTPLTGVSILTPKTFQDQRGSFVKTYHVDSFQELGLDFTPKEEFYSISHKGVIRGMHFQTPPADHAKVVFCISGNVLDVVVDLRVSSPSYGKYITVELSGANHNMLFIPSGFAHGFLSLKDHSVMMYLTNHIHSPENDSGIRWNSFGFKWPCENPQLSNRDRSLVDLAHFRSLFE